MKIAITGKGGVGKTTIAAGLSRAYARRGKKVIALDVDPSPNLITALGVGGEVPERKLIPLMERDSLIEERTGAPPEGYGLIFKLNPKVDDLLDKFGVQCKDGVKLLIVGRIRRGGQGCFCPANALARRLVDHLSGVADVLLLDMEAGVEHLGRGTTRKVEILLTVVEPSLRSIETAGRIKKLGEDLGITKIFGVINKYRDRENEFISTKLQKIGVPPIYSIPYEESVARAELKGVSVFDAEGGERILEKMTELSEVVERAASSG